MKQLFVIFTICSAVHILSAVELSKCIIFYDASSPQSVKDAAQELQEHLAKAVSVKLPVATSPRSPMIALGDSKAAQDAGIFGSKLEYEEYVIRTVGSDLFIVGHDIPNDGKNEFFGDSFGTRYATYDFLEKVIGVRWLLPGPQGTYIPNLGVDYDTGKVNLRFRPRFASRRLIFGWPRDKYRDEWTKFNKFIPNPAFQSGYRYLHNWHSWGYLFPQKGHFSTKYNLSALDTYRNHPEYFGMSPSGNRVSPAGEFSLCLSNPALLDDMAERVKNSVRCEKERFTGWNDYQYSCISPADGQPSCWCKTCRSNVLKNDYEKTGAVAYPRDLMNWSPLVFPYYRRICELLPDYTLSGYVYYNYEFTYPGIKPMPKNFIGIMAPLHTGYGPVRLYEPVNQTWHKWQESWDGIFQEQIYYGCDFWMRQNCGAPMSPYPGLMKDTFQTLLKRPYVGLFIYSNNGYGHSGVYNWMMMKLEWDPTLDPYELMNDYLEKSYGSEAAPILSKFYFKVEKGMKNFIARRQGKTGYNCSPELLKEVYADQWDVLEALFLQANQTSKDPDQEWRFSMLRENVRLLHYHLMHLGLVDKPAPEAIAMSEEEFQKFNESRNNDALLNLCIDPMEQSSYRHAAIMNVNAIPDSVPGAKKLPNHDFFMYHQDIVVCAENDGFGEMQLEYHTVKNPYTGQAYLPEIGYFCVYDASGKLLYSAIANKGLIRFPVQKGKLYYLIKGGLQDYMSSCSWRISHTSNIYYAFGQKIDPQGVLCESLKSPVYFYVRKGVEQFDLHLTMSTREHQLFDSSGKLVSESTNKDKGYQTVRIDAPSQGWWKLSIGNGSNGVSGYLRLGEELDPFIVVDPEKALRVSLP